MRLYLIRHGETKYNVEKIFRGRLDISLSDLGVEHAESLGKYLSKINFEIIFSSPLRRALETANIISKHQRGNIKVEVDEDLIDISYGEWEGKREGEVKRLYPKLYREWHLNPHRVRFPNGESLQDVKVRLEKFIEKVTSKFKGEIAIVSHRVVLKILICMLLGLNISHFWNIRIDCGGITIFDYDGRFILYRHNDTSYLNGLSGHELIDF